MLPESHGEASEPSLVDAVIHVFEAGQRVVLDRLDLARFDVDRFAAQVLRGAALIAVGSVLLSGAWFALMAGVVVWLQPSLSLAASLTATAAITTIAGSITIALGIQRARGDGAVVRLASDLVGTKRGANGAADGVTQP
jgi:hypothetical protein